MEAQLALTAAVAASLRPGPAAAVASGGGAPPLPLCTSGLASDLNFDALLPAGPGIVEMEGEAGAASQLALASGAGGPGATGAPSSGFGGSCVVGISAGQRVRSVGRRYGNYGSAAGRAVPRGADVSPHCILDGPGRGGGGWECWLPAAFVSAHHVGGHLPGDLQFRQ